MLLEMIKSILPNIGPTRLFFIIIIIAIIIITIMIIEIIIIDNSTNKNIDEAYKNIINNVNYNDNI